jgi:hypothetical protein
MTDHTGSSSESRSPSPAEAGLCAACRHARRIESQRGSVFLLCERAREDPTFMKYPPLPVLECGGFEVPERATPPGTG